MKRRYEKPATQVTDIQQEGFICNTNEVHRTDGDTNLEYGGIGDSEVHAPRYSVWDEE